MVNCLVPSKGQGGNAALKREYCGHLVWFLVALGARTNNVRSLDSLLNNWTICSLDIYSGAGILSFFHWILADASEFRLLRVVAFSPQLLHPAPHYWFSFLFSQRISFCSDLEKDRGLTRLRLRIIGIHFFTLSNTLLRSTTSTFRPIFTLGTSCLMLWGFLFVCPALFPEHFSFLLELEDGDDFRANPLISSFNSSTS